MRYRAKENYELRSIVGEHMLIPTGGSDFAPGTLLMLNETGCFLWELLQQPKSREELLAAARAEFEDRDGGMEASIREFLDHMVAQGLLTVEGE
jgi:hypothetical protein